jgi:hypothetical protein
VRLFHHDAHARLAVVTRWSWIKKSRRNACPKKRETSREYVDGESHYSDGHRYLLSVVKAQRLACFAIEGNGCIELYCRDDASHSTKQKIIRQFLQPTFK